MTTNTDSLLSDFGRHNDRHLEAARKTIAPEVRNPKPFTGTTHPQAPEKAPSEKPKGAE